MTSALAQFGDVADAYIIVDRETGLSRGFGFAEMPNAEQAQRAIESLDGYPWYGRLINVSKAHRGDGGSALMRPIEEVPAGPIDGENRTFTLSLTPLNGFVGLQLNGLQQNPFIPDYAVSEKTITYTVAPQTGDSHWCMYFTVEGQ